MRFTIARRDLQNAMSALQPALPAKSTIPVLTNILVETAETGLRLTATDLDMTVSVMVAAEVETAGAITIPGKKLHEIARELPDKPVTIGTKGDQRIAVDCGTSHFKLLGLPKDEFPTMPTVEFDDGFTMLAADLARMFTNTGFAVSTEASRPILNGVLWELRPGVTRMVATNGHRLALQDQPGLGTANGQSIDVIVPPKALALAAKLFDGAGQVPVDVAVTSIGHIGLRTPTTTILCRTIEGPYPNYNQVIPKDNTRTALIDRDAFTRALKRVSILASAMTHRVRLSFADSTLTLSVQTPDAGEATDAVEIHYEGDALDIGFNATYLLEVLKYVPTDEITMRMKAPERAATIEPTGGDLRSQLFLVMPLRLLD